MHTMHSIAIDWVHILNEKGLLGAVFEVKSNSQGCLWRALAASSATSCGTAAHRYKTLRLRGRCCTTLTLTGATAQEPSLCFFGAGAVRL